MYKVSNAGVSLAFVIEVSMAACLDLTKFLCVVIALGIAVDFSAFLVIYQSVFANSLAACDLTSLIKLYFNPLVTIWFPSSSFLASPSEVPSGASPSSISSCVQTSLTSACALAVAVPYVAVTLPLPNA